MFVIIFSHFSHEATGWSSCDLRHWDMLMTLNHNKNDDKILSIFLQLKGKLANRLTDLRVFHMFSVVLMLNSSRTPMSSIIMLFIRVQIHERHFVRSTCSKTQSENMQLEFLVIYIRIK